MTTSKTTKRPAAKPARGRKPAEVADRTLMTFVRDSAYAAIGATDSAVALARSLPEKAQQLRKTATSEQLRERLATTPKRMQDLQREVRTLAGQAPEKLGGSAQQLLRDAEAGFDTLAARGRKVADSIRNSAPVRRAADQAGVAKRQTKAAATSTRKAADAGASAAKHAAGKVGDSDR